MKNKFSNECEKVICVLTKDEIMITTDEEMQIIKESLKRELALLESKANLLKREIDELEKKYRMKSNEFLAKFEKGELGDDQDLFEWWGLLRGLKKIEENIEKIRALLSK